MTRDVLPSGQQASPQPRLSLRLAAAAPAVLGTVAVLVFIGLESAGLPPLSLSPRTLAEAAAMGNGADVLRLIRSGADPNRVEDVRAEIVAPRFVRLTALEAAVFSRQVHLVDLFDRHGAIVTADGRQSLACLARDIDAHDIFERLSRPADPPCDPGAVLARLVMRTSEARQAAVQGG